MMIYVSHAWCQVLFAIDLRLHFGLTDGLSHVFIGDS